jgi:hypothetical protein
MSEVVHDLLGGLGLAGAGLQGLTLVHFSAQPEPFLTLKYPLNAYTPPPTPAINDP